MSRLALLFVFVAACGSMPMMDDSGMPHGGALGASCGTDADCQSMRCLVSGSTRFCTATCASDADCPAMIGGMRLACGVGPDGTNECVPPCGTLRYTCVAGVSTSCDVVTDDAHCIDCRCSDVSTHCVRDVGCLPPQDVGGACTLDTDCTSRNCSTFAGVCRTSVGAICDATNCDECLHLPSGTTSCSRECRTSSDCRGEACVGDTTLMDYRCKPGACTGSTSTCTVESAPHELGQECHDDAQCRSGHCFESQRCIGADCIGEGWCTAPCTSDAECGAGTRCVTIPCASGQTAECGTVCLKACEGFTDCGVYGGTCSGLEDTMRGIAMVCDVRHDVGGSCTSDPECISTHCVSGTCAM